MTEAAPADNAAHTGLGPRSSSPPRWRRFAWRAVLVLVIAIGGYYIGRHAERQDDKQRATPIKTAPLPTLQDQLAVALQNQIKSIEIQLQAVSNQQPPVGQAAQISNLQAQIKNVQSNLSALQGQLGSLQKRLDQMSPSNQRAEIEALTAQLKVAENKLREIMPSYPHTPHTYNIQTNQSLVVEGGRLQIGLVGSPRQENVILNLNGVHRSVAAGDIINTELDSSTSCRVNVVSIDVLKATAVVTATCGAIKS